MIDDETRQRAKEYTEGFAEATADDPKPPAPDLEPMEVAKAEEAASRPVVDDDARVFSEAFHSVTEQAEPAKAAEPVAPAAPMNFKQAFAQARKDGLKVFEFN